MLRDYFVEQRKGVNHEKLALHGMHEGCDV